MVGPSDCTFLYFILNCLNHSLTWNIKGEEENTKKKNKIEGNAVL